MSNKKLLKEYNRLLHYLNKVETVQQSLSRIASRYAGFKLHADITNGGEIEFRRVKCERGTETVQDFTTIRIEELLNLKGSEK